MNIAVKTRSVNPRWSRPKPTLYICILSLLRRFGCFVDGPRVGKAIEALITAMEQDTHDETGDGEVDS